MINPIVKQISDEEAADDVKELFEGMKANTGKVPKWMRVMANNHDVVIGFFKLFKALMDDAPVDKLTKWKVALHVSKINQCQFCIGVAEAQLSALGVDQASMKDLEKIINEKERAAIRYSEAATTHAYKIEDEIIDELKHHYNDAEIVEITSVVGLFNYINRFNDALKILPDSN